MARFENRKNTDAHNFSHYQHKPRFKSISKIPLSLESITCPLYRLMLNFAFCVYEKIFYMNYVAPLLYFANKVNLEKSYKSAKCVCYHQICATKMEHVINPAPLTLCKELTLIVRFSISKAFSIYKLSWKRNDMVREATKKMGKIFLWLPWKRVICGIWLDLCTGCFFTGF